MINRWSRVCVTLFSLLVLQAGILSAQNVSRQQQRAMRRSTDQAGQMLRTMTRTQARTHQLTQNMASNVARVRTQQRTLEQQGLGHRAGDPSGSQAGPGTETTNRARYMWQHQLFADAPCEGECAGDQNRLNRYRAENGDGMATAGERDRIRDRAHQSVEADDGSQ